MRSGMVESKAVMHLKGIPETGIEDDTPERPLNATIILPTYNEAQNIESLIGQILCLYPDFRIIVVDDNSPDGTGMIVDELTVNDSRISIIHRKAKLGLGSACAEGFKEALAEGADLIFEMDADFSHDPKYIKDLLELSEAYDMVIGSRYVNGVRVEGLRFRRLIMSKCANMFVSYVTAKPVRDFTAGFRCYRRRVLESIDIDKMKSDGYAFQIEMTHLAHKHGFSVVEAPITFKEQAQGASKISGNVIWGAFRLTLRCRASILDVARHLYVSVQDI